MNDTTRYRLPELELLDAAAPLPKRAVVGGEAFNSERKTVSLRAVMESDAWRNSRAELPVALGEDVSGDPVVIDLARTPHLLVAGTTGTGKSVCLNSIIMSLLFKFRPDELKFVMVDTGGVEFAETANSRISSRRSSTIPTKCRWRSVGSPTSGTAVT